MTKTIYCVECGMEFTPDHHNRLDGLDNEAYMCDTCLLEDAEKWKDERVRTTG